MNDLPATAVKDELKIEFEARSVGRMRSTGETLLLFLQLEGTYWDQISVLDDVLDVLGIKPEALVHYRHRPSVSYESEREVWEREHFERFPESLR